MKILITAPSLDESENVSGISSVVRLIIMDGSAEFVHFSAGRKDSKKIGITWIIDQISLLPRFVFALGRSKPDILHVNTAMTPLAVIRDWFLVFFARLSGCPVLLHIHGGKAFTKGNNSRIFKLIVQGMLKRANIIVVLSEREELIIRNYKQNLIVKVLKNAVSLDEVQGRISGNSKLKTIVFLGRLHEGKGIREIIDACKDLKTQGFEFRFRCFGAGDLEEYFVEEMTEILGENFFFGGTVSGKAKWEVLANGDIFLLPSHYEGLPMSLLEAMAAGCVPVVSNVGSIGEVVTDEINGFLIEPRNHNQIVNALKRLLSGEFDWNELSKNAQSAVKKHHDISVYIKTLQEIYEKLAK